MQSVKIYPAELGVSGWLETSTYKNHQFNHEDEILDEYDYVVVGAGFLLYQILCAVSVRRGFCFADAPEGSA